MSFGEQGTSREQGTSHEQRTFEGQRLSEMLHRLTPEPPRRVTVEDVAIRIANNNAPPRGARKGVARMAGGRTGSDGRMGSDGGMAGGRTGGGRRPGRGRLAPLLAAASVVVVAGASAGIAVALTSHSSRTQLAGSGAPTSATSPANSVTSSPADTGAPAVQNTVSPPPASDSAWHASVVVSSVFTPGSLVASGNYLYTFTDDNLLEINPRTGATVNKAPSNGFPGQAPVVADGKVWVVTSFSGGSIELSRYDVGTLASAGTLSVQASGLSPSSAGILAAGPNGYLYLASVSGVIKVNPASGTVTWRYPVTGTAVAVAVSPDGSTLYAGSLDGTSFKLAEYNAATGARLGTASVPASSGGEMVATPGGVWFTTSSSTAGQVWFAPAGNLSGARLIASTGTGVQSADPTYADGAVWVGGAQRLECLDPDTGQLRASSLIPARNGVQQDIGDIAVLNGSVYALYQTDAGATGGVVLLSPPAACSASSPPSTGS